MIQPGLDSRSVSTLSYCLRRVLNLLEICAIVDTLEGMKEAKDTKSSLKEFTIKVWR